MLLVRLETQILKIMLNLFAIDLNLKFQVLQYIYICVCVCVRVCMYVCIA